MTILLDIPLNSPSQTLMPERFESVEDLVEYIETTPSTAHKKDYTPLNHWVGDCTQLVF